MSEFAVKAETAEGRVFTLRRGFSCAEEAEEHPVKLSLWKRVWVEEIPDVEPLAPPSLPPMPWSWETVPTYGGKNGFIYIRDANGRRIGSILGRKGEKQMIADFICAASRKNVRGQ